MFYNTANGALVGAWDVLAGAAIAGAVGAEVGRVERLALVHVEATQLAVLARLRHVARPAHALEPVERVAALGLAVPAPKTRQVRAHAAHSTLVGAHGAAAVSQGEHHVKSQVRLNETHNACIRLLAAQQLLLTERGQQPYYEPP